MQRLLSSLQKQYPHIKLECAIPCENQELKWHNDSKNRYRDILEQADIKTYISHYYFTGCMQKRNHYMVDKSDLVIAFYNGSPGGTQQTIAYAEKKGKPCIIYDV